MLCGGSVDDVVRDFFFFNDTATTEIYTDWTHSFPTRRSSDLFARAAEAVLGISAPVLQVVAAFRHQLTASIFGVAVAIGSGWLIVGHLDPLTGVTLATAVGLVVMAAIPMVQLAITEKLHPFDAQFPVVRSEEHTSELQYL